MHTVCILLRNTTLESMYTTSVLGEQYELVCILLIMHTSQSSSATSSYAYHGSWYKYAYYSRSTQQEYYQASRSTIRLVRVVRVILFFCVILVSNTSQQFVSLTNLTTFIQPPPECLHAKSLPLFSQGLSAVLTDCLVSRDSIVSSFPPRAVQHLIAHVSFAILPHRQKGEARPCRSNFRFCPEYLSPPIMVLFCVFVTNLNQRTRK